MVNVFGSMNGMRLMFLDYSVNFLMYQEWNFHSVLKKKKKIKKYFENPNGLLVGNFIGLRNFDFFHNWNLKSENIRFIVIKH